MTHLINRKRFILNNIETLLNTQLGPEFIDETLKDQPLPDLLNMLKNDSREAIQLLKFFQYEIPPNDFEQLSQQNYSDLFRLKDRVNLMKASDNFKYLSENALTFYHMLFLAIECVEQFLESIGFRSLAAHETLPEYFRESRKAALRQDNLLLRSKCKSRSVDPAVMEMLQTYFQNFLAANQILQKELDFSEQLMAALLKLFAVQQQEEYDLLIMSKLISMNFNSGDFYYHCRRKIIAAVKEHSENPRKLQALNWHLKELKTLLPVSGIALNTGYPTIKGLLLDFVEAEIKYFEARALVDYRESSNLPSTVYSGTPAGTGNDESILNVNANMRELALFAQLLMERNVVPVGEGGIKEITAFLSKHVRTTGGEKLSANSLSKRYREAHPATCATVLKMLEDMIEILQRNHMR